MKDVYPDLIEKAAYIRKVIVNEEQRFIETLDAGLRILQEEVAALKTAGAQVIPGDIVFKLYDTFGFPTDLTADIVRKDGFTLDMEGFEKAMDAQREKARESWKGSGEEAISEIYQKLSVEGIATGFVGYEGGTEGDVAVMAILKNGADREEIRRGERGGDHRRKRPRSTARSAVRSAIRASSEGDGFLFEVTDTRRPLDNLITHVGKLKRGTIRGAIPSALQVDDEYRRATEANHSGTHVLQAALKAVLGDHIKQSGSLVNAERLRFDFTHFSKIDDEELAQDRNRGQPDHPGELSRRDAGHAPGRGGENGGDGGLRREVRRRRSGWSRWAMSAWNSVAAPMSAGPVISAFSRSSTNRPSPPASAGSRP